MAKNLLEPRSNPQILQEVARILVKEFGDISIDGTDMKFHNTSRPPESVIAAAREKAIDRFNAMTVNNECRERIYAVVDDITQTNINAWIIELLTREKLTKADQTDIAAANALRQWIEKMREAARELIENADPTFRTDGRWPRPPANVKALVERF